MSAWAKRTVAAAAGADGRRSAAGRTSSRKDPVSGTTAARADRRRPAPARDGGEERFGLLLAVLITTYLLSAFISAYWVRVIQVTLFLVVALLAVRTSMLSRRTELLAIAAAAAGSVISLVLALVLRTGPGAGAGYLGTAAVLLFAVVLIVRRVLLTSQLAVTLQSIFGAISAYLVIGLMFAAIYAAISAFQGGAFFAGQGAADVRTFQYFSFTTLTTVGYGDFTAAESGGRAMAVMEALIGQIFLATLIARLVSAYRGPARGGRYAASRRDRSASRIAVKKRRSQGGNPRRGRRGLPPWELRR